MNILEARRRTLGKGVYKKTVEGNPAIAQGSLTRRYPGITMQGWTEQDSTTGAQLFDKSTAISGKYISDSNGNEQDGEGTYASDYIAVSGLSNIICSSTKSRMWMAFYDAEKMYVSGKNGYEKPIPVPENAVYARFTIANNSIDSFMVNAGQTLLPYEPYTGGQPSPSPDYPQPITSAGKWNEDTQKWEYEITIANEQTDPDKNQTVLLTSDRPLTKWDRLEKRNGQWGWVYGSVEIDPLDFNTMSGMGIWGNVDGYKTLAFYSYVNGTNENENYHIDTTNANKSLCDYFENRNVYLTSNIGFAIGAYLAFRVPRDLLPEWDENSPSNQPFIDWLQQMKESGNPITVIAPTLITKFSNLTESEQEQMNALYTFRPTTVLSNDCDCNMTLTYKTKKSLEVAT